MRKRRNTSSSTLIGSAPINLAPASPVLPPGNYGAHQGVSGTRLSGGVSNSVLVHQSGAVGNRALSPAAGNKQITPSIGNSVLSNMRHHPVAVVAPSRTVRNTRASGTRRSSIRGASSAPSRVVGGVSPVPAPAALKHATSATPSVSAPAQPTIDQLVEQMLSGARKQNQSASDQYQTANQAIRDQLTNATNTLQGGVQQTSFTPIPGTENNPEAQKFATLAANAQTAGANSLKQFIADRGNAQTGLLGVLAAADKNRLAFLQQQEPSVRMDLRAQLTKEQAAEQAQAQEALDKHLVTEIGLKRLGVDAARLQADSAYKQGLLQNSAADRALRAQTTQANLAARGMEVGAKLNAAQRKAISDIHGRLFTTKMTKDANGNQVPAYISPQHPLQDSLAALISEGGLNANQAAGLAAQWANSSDAYKKNGASGIYHTFLASGVSPSLALALTRQHFPMFGHKPVTAVTVNL